MPKYFKFTDGRQLQVGTFYGIGRNYEAHALEMGGAVPSRIMVFTKPPSAFIEDGESILLPQFAQLVHHELELVVVIGSKCTCVEPANALDYVAGYAVGIDVTLRDVQSKAREEGAPWAVAKGFATSAPVSMVVPTENTDKTAEFSIELRINGELRQKGNTSQMTRSVAELVSFLSKIFTLAPGDAIFTGTPEGVGPINAGDEIHAELKGFIALDVGAKIADYSI